MKAQPEWAPPRLDLELKRNLLNLVDSKAASTTKEAANLNLVLGHANLERSQPCLSEDPQESDYDNQLADAPKVNDKPN